MDYSWRAASFLDVYLAQLASSSTFSSSSSTSSSSSSSSSYPSSALSSAPASATTSATTPAAASRSAYTPVTIPRVPAAAATRASTLSAAPVTVSSNSNAVIAPESSSRTTELQRLHYQQHLHERQQRLQQQLQQLRLLEERDRRESNSSSSSSNSHRNSNSNSFNSRHNSQTNENNNRSRIWVRYLNQGDSTINSRDINISSRDSLNSQGPPSTDYATISNIPNRALLAFINSNNNNNNNNGRSSRPFIRSFGGWINIEDSTSDRPNNWQDGSDAESNAATITTASRDCEEEEEDEESDGEHDSEDDEDNDSDFISYAEQEQNEDPVARMYAENNDSNNINAANNERSNGPPAAASAVPGAASANASASRNATQAEIHGPANNNGYNAGPIIIDVPFFSSNNINNNVNTNNNIININNNPEITAAHLGNSTPLNRNGAVSSSNGAVANDVVTINTNTNSNASVSQQSNIRGRYNGGSARSIANNADGGNPNVYLQPNFYSGITEALGIVAADSSSTNALRRREHARFLAMNNAVVNASANAAAELNNPIALGDATLDAAHVAAAALFDDPMMESHMRSQRILAERVNMLNVLHQAGAAIAANRANSPRSLGVIAAATEEIASANRAAAAAAQAMRRREGLANEMARVEANMNNMLVLRDNAAPATVHGMRGFGSSRARAFGGAMNPNVGDNASLAARVEEATAMMQMRANNGLNGPIMPPYNIIGTDANGRPVTYRSAAQSFQTRMQNMHSSHERPRSLPVCCLFCRYCEIPITNRGMKAILLADADVELFSTDCPPATVIMCNTHYVTEKCQCRIRDLGCINCGNMLGYHVTQPCKKCLRSGNNGHFFMFHKENVTNSKRFLPGSQKLVYWYDLPDPDADVNIADTMTARMIH